MVGYNKEIDKVIDLFNQFDEDSDYIKDDIKNVKLQIKDVMSNINILIAFIGNKIKHFKGDKFNSILLDFKAKQKRLIEINSLLQSYIVDMESNKTKGYLVSLRDIIKELDVDLLNESYEGIILPDVKDLKIGDTFETGEDFQVKGFGHFLASETLYQITDIINQNELEINYIELNGFFNKYANSLNDEVGSITKEDLHPDFNILGWITKFNNQLVEIPTTELNLDEDLLDDDSFTIKDQEFTSKSTAHGNGKANGGLGRVPTLFKNIKANLKAGDVLFDYGCGEESTVNQIKKYLSDKNIIYIGWDKFNYNSDKSLNELVVELRQNYNGGADIATCANVLNVIKEQEVRHDIIEHMYKILKPGGIACFNVYYDNKKTGLKQTGLDKWQEFRSLDSYINEVEELFGEHSVIKQKNILIVKK